MDIKSEFTVYRPSRRNTYRVRSTSRGEKAQSNLQQASYVVPYHSIERLHEASNFLTRDEEGLRYGSKKAMQRFKQVAYDEELDYLNNLFNINIVV
ncbi:hypothetical protein [Pleionea sediminis]|uniref:hypothetical protein n=1 Tax=Pleionea sediminis TaxID=2569479 RepID=UPI0013DDFC51|nr:hypothetical protein [Pleionea sediminis]